ncbi:MAG TPA: polyprenyl synthetase family protein [Jatrophihabitans sp.]|jgi:geranylgeranyl diphosphate synthase type I|nr:polyprenyl synthetase family protein [Jatrophihabitans sp.]
MSSTHPGVKAALTIATEVQGVLDTFFARQGQDFDLVDADLADLIEAARAATGAGKRLRAAFCYWAYRATGGQASQPILEVASALEMLHAAALVHDDIIDAAPTRRGMPSAQRRFATMAAKWRPSGEDAEFGLAAAILLGDLLLMWADEMFSGCEFDSLAVRRTRPWFNVMRSEVLAGAYLELVVHARRQADLSTALLILRYKSAKYTVQRPVQIGAALADATPAQLATLGDFGLAAGEAFQLRDDLLSTFGEPGLVGKPVGIDLRDGKCPVLVAIARAQASPAAVRELDRLCERPPLTADQVARMRDILIEAGVVDTCEQMIAERLDRARTTLHRGQFADEAAVAMLDTLAIACGHRSV